MSYDQPAASESLEQFIRAMPKAEIHVHLEGAIQPETVLTLARKHNRIDRLPGDNVEALRRWFAFTDFPHFIQIYITISDLLRDGEDFALIVYAAGEDMAAQGIRYRELTFTPFTHTHLLQKGLQIEAILEGLDDGAQRARRDFGVEMRWVFDIPRNPCFHNGVYTDVPAETTLAYALAGMIKGVVGFGLGGFEVGAPPEPFAPQFARAKAAGLASVPHAGETVGPASVWGAVEALGANRIGHGVRAIEDPALLVCLHETQIPLEINPTSNICLHVYPRIAEHPFVHLDRMGLYVTVNSDDPPLFNTSLVQEYRTLAHEFGYDRANLARIARRAFAASAAEASVREQMLAEFDAWVAANLADEDNA